MLPVLLLVGPRDEPVLLLILLGYLSVLFGTGMTGSRRAVSVTTAGGLALLSLASGLLSAGQPIWVLLAALFAVAVLAVAIDQGFELGPPGPYYFLILVTMGSVIRILDLELLGWLLLGVAGAIAVSMLDELWSRRHLQETAIAAAGRCINEFERDVNTVGAATSRQLTARVDEAVERLQDAWRLLERSSKDRDLAQQLRSDEDRFLRLCGHLIRNTLARGSSQLTTEPGTAQLRGSPAFVEPSVGYRLRRSLLSPSMALVTLARVNVAIFATLVLGALIQPMHPIWTTLAVVMCLGTPGAQHELTRRILAVMAGMLVGLLGYGLLLQLPRDETTLLIVLVVLLLTAIRVSQYRWGIGTICISMTVLALSNPGVAAGRQWQVVLDRFFESVIACVVCLVIVWVTGGWLVGWVISGNIPALVTSIRRTLGASLELDEFTGTDQRPARAELLFCLRRSGSAARLTTATQGRGPATLDLEGALARIGLVALGASLDPSVWPSREMAMRVVDQLRHLGNITVTDSTDDLQRLRQRVDEILPHRPGVTL